MRTDLYQEMYSQEEYYWWHLGKRKLILSFLSLYLKRKSKLKLADMGCGTGKMMEDLNKFGQVWGFDSSPKALNFCRKRGHLLLSKVDISTTLPLENNSFDVVLALDVLEHMRFDELSISEFNRILVAGGILIVTVPAYQFLWSYWDQMLGHQRRYDKRDLILKLQKNGLSVQKISHFNSSILPLVFIFRLIKGMFQKNNQRLNSDFVPLPSLVNNFLCLLSDIEKKLILKINIPFGLSLICIAKKE